MAELKPCPWCGSIDLQDCYVYVKCNKCLAEGPKMNGGRLDHHADYIDHEGALSQWNARNDEAARKEERERCIEIVENDCTSLADQHFIIKAIRKMGEK